MSLEAFNERLAEWHPDDLRTLDCIVRRAEAERAVNGRRYRHLPGMRTDSRQDDWSNEDFLIAAGLQIGHENLAVFSHLAATRPHPRDVRQRAGIDYWAVFTLLGWGRTLRRGKMTKNGWTDIVNAPEPFVMPVTTEGVFALAFLRTITHISGHCVRLH